MQAQSNLIVLPTPLLVQHANLGRKLILIMENGLEVPVSQTYLANAKAALKI